MNGFCPGTFLNKQTEKLAAEPGLVGQTDPPSPHRFPTLRAVCSRLPARHGPWGDVCTASCSPSQNVFHFGNTNIKQSPAPSRTKQAVPFPVTPRSARTGGAVANQTMSLHQPFTPLAPVSDALPLLPAQSLLSQTVGPSRKPQLSALRARQAQGGTFRSPGRQLASGRGAGFSERTIPSLLRMQSPGPPHSWP